MKKFKKILIMIVVSLCTIFINVNTLNAASATFKVSSSSSKVVVGNTFTITVKVSSTELLGSWEYTIDYNSSYISLVSGTKSIAAFGDGSIKSKSYTYKFKAIKSGSTNISVKSAGAYSWSESQLSTSILKTSINIVTKAEVQASYSKDNNLKSLSVNDLPLTPTFISNIVDYSIDLDSNTKSINIKALPNDSKATVNGTGTFEVIEGENKFTIIVTAENGSEKKYNIVANVIDPNPIKVKTSIGEELTIVKRVSALTFPSSYVETKIKISNQEVPAFTSEITNFTLVGLKNSKGEINLYIYDDNTFTKYTEIKLNELTILPIDENIENLENYIKTKITINNEKITAYKYNKKSNFAIITAIDTENGEKNKYTYDIKNNTAIFYNNEEIKMLNSKSQTYLYIIIGFLVETFLLFILIILLLKRKTKQIRKTKEKLNKAKEHQKEIFEKDKEEEIKKDLKKKKSKKKK